MDETSLITRLVKWTDERPGNIFELELDEQSRHAAHDLDVPILALASLGGCSAAIVGYRMIGTLVRERDLD